MPRFLSKLLTYAFICLLLLITTDAARKCGQGTFDNSSKCEDCPPGTYQNELGQTSCKKCPAGTFNRYSGAEAEGLCRSCGYTAISKEGATACTSCPRGKVANRFSEKCVSCKPGFEVSIECEKCAAGQISTENNSRNCVFCPEGHRANKARTKCVSPNCPPGQMNEVGSCVDCYVDTFRMKGMDTCEPCPPRTLSGFGAARCVFCPKGKFIDHNGFGYNCIKCPEGTATRGKGAILCRIKNAPCPTGFFENKVGDCLTCPKGYQYNVKAKRCDICAYGEYSTGGLVLNCLKCKPGQRGDRDGCKCPGGTFLSGGRCKKCPPGTAREEYQDESTCTPCDGYFSQAGAENCSPCPGSASSPDGIKCEVTPELLPCPEVKDGSPCTDPKTGCPPGMKRANDYTPITCKYPDEKLDCPNGVIDGKHSTCVSCEKGEFIKETSSGRLRCSSCPRNEVSPGGDARKCTKCPRGFTRSHRDPAKCACPFRKVVGSDGKCGRCPRGYEISHIYYDTFPRFCRICRPGTFEEFELCAACPRNTFSGEGATKCKPCPKGHVTYGLSEPTCLPLFVRGKCVPREVVSQCEALNEGTKCRLTKVRTLCNKGRTVTREATSTLNRSCGDVAKCTPYARFLVP